MQNNKNNINNKNGLDSQPYRQMRTFPDVSRRSLSAYICNDLALLTLVRSAEFITFAEFTAKNIVDQDA